MKIAGTEQKVIGANIGFQNTPLPLAQEKVAFDPYIDGVTIIGRQLVVELIVKYEDPGLYAQVRTGSTTGTTWSATPHVASFEVEAQTDVLMPSTTPVPYSMNIKGANVMLQQQGPLMLAGNQTVLQRMAGVAIEGSGVYTEWTIRNMVADYAWPT